MYTLPLNEIERLQIKDLSRFEKKVTRIIRNDVIYREKKQQHCVRALSFTTKRSIIMPIVIKNGHMEQRK